MGQSGQHEPMNSEEAIAKLPASLQPVFKQTMEVERNSELAHLNAELAMQRSIRGTLERTKQFLATASDEEQKTVGMVLMYFHNQDEDRHGPMGGPGGHGGPPPGMGGQGGMPGGPGMGMPGDVKEMIRKMIEEVDGEIRQLEQELKNQ